MFSSPRLTRSSMEKRTAAKRILDEKCQTIEQLQTIIDELKCQHEKKEHELIKHIGILYSDLHQSKKKMAHLLFKYQQQKKLIENLKPAKDCAIQTDEIPSSSVCSNCSTQSHKSKSSKKTSEKHPKYYTLQLDNNLEYISATPSQPPSDHSLSSPSLSTTDQSSTKHNESSSSAYNTADSLPSSAYSDEIESLERVLNAACTMYTTHENLEHTIKLQEELFRQRLRLRGVNLIDKDEVSSEHFYDNIDSETSDMEKQPIIEQTRALPWYHKKQQRTVTFNLNADEPHKVKPIPNKVRFSDQCYPISKRKTFRSSSKTNLSKLSNTKKNACQHAIITNKKLLLSNMLTVTIT